MRANARRKPALPQASETIWQTRETASRTNWKSSCAICFDLRLNIEVRNGQRVLLDELATRLDLIAHQRGEDVVRGERVLDAHLDQPARRRGDRRVPELFGIHLAETFVALDQLPTTGLLQQPLDRLLEARHFLALVALHHVRARL